MHVMRARLLGVFFLVLIVAAPVLATEQAGHAAAPASEADGPQKIRAAVNHLLLNNAAFMHIHKEDYFRPFVEAQHPLATVVSCSDSRVQMHAFDSSPDNDIFVIRNIGNQLSTAEGSVDYGVHHLHTPVLIFIGHVRCGAIKAASGSYWEESPEIRKELDTIHIEKGGDWTANVVTNINNQVAVASKKYAAEIKEGKLAVLGAIYDFANDLKQGAGRLEIINVNGDTSYFAVKSFLSKNAPAPVSAATAVTKEARGKPGRKPRVHH